MEDMIPTKFQHYNAKIKTFHKTYYFAHATGDRKKIREKAREILSEPKKLHQNYLGFNSDVRKELKYRNTTQKLKRRNPKNPIRVIE